MSTRFAALRAAPTAPDGRTVADALTGLAAVAAAGRFLAALAVNAPAGPGGVPVDMFGVLAVVLAAGALVALGLTRSDARAGVGFLVAGVFGLLSVAGSVVPAAVAVPVGLGVVLAARRETVGPARTVLGGLLVGSLVLALASGGGGLPGLRGVASTATLLSLGATPLGAAPDGRALVGGSAAAGAVVAAGVALPFVTGAVTLVAVGAVGSPLPVVAVAVGGTVTAASAATRGRAWLVLAGVALVALAGVPTTLGRAVPFALGVAALLRGGER